MEREVIELSEHICRSILDDEYEEYVEGEDLGFDYIDKIVRYTDIEKSYSNVDIILKRNSDSKLFKFDHNDSLYLPIFEDHSFPLKAVETFPRTKEITIYE